jgi:protein-S-isoprenylcysteine O-methyltransferase Ste14
VLHQAILQFALPVLWIAWLLVWFVASLNIKPARWRESIGSGLLHRVPLLFTALLLALRRQLPSLLTERFLPAGPAYDMLGIIMVAFGLGFAVWARWHLGSNWSGAVTLKQDHSLIRTGPYRYVRHPIYSGLLLALLGTAVTLGEWRGLVAFVLAFLAFAYKSRVEEARMRETFPDYASYSRETAALIPLVF